MATSKQTRVILSKNINLDKEYKEVLNYSEQQMLNLMQDNDHLIYRGENLTYIREEGNTISLKIDSSFTYQQAITCTYLAFVNPDYENKWFFAFVDDVVYKSNGTVEIKYIVDVMTTWFNRVTPSQSFVVREHTMDDTLGNNTLPENLEIGEYVVTDYWRLAYGLRNCYICIGVSSLPANFPSQIILGSRIYNGIYSGLRYFIFKDETSASKFIRGYDNERMAEAIYTIFLVPTGFITSTTTSEWENVTIGNQTGITLGVYLPSNDPVSIFNTQQVSVPDNLNGYTPKNNKLFTYPYSYMYITNNCGGDVIYNYEDFDGQPVFACDGALCVGCSIKMYPRNYKKLPVDDNEKRLQYNYGINGGKYPTCSWASDSFTNWITQNAVNIGLGLVGGAAVVGAGFLTGGTALAAAGMIGGGTMSIASTLNQVYQHTAVPEQAQGNTNSGDVVTSGHEMGFTLFNMSIKSQYAKIVDEYFTRFGYKTNLTKVPNINGRRYFNYVQIADSEVIGYGEVPNKYMDEINRIFRRGVTIWHDHTKIGDYTVNNTIITP